ncbi:MAG: hypothetical protein FJY76_00965 [Candidatus Aenigmarchaeota archaeon]|nr:hypothetical protein [Candidatus Aenigmarchaeota archaeon]
MEIQMCQLCKEPIANFVCIHRMGRGIAQWLPSPAREAFEMENARFLQTFSYMPADTRNHAEPVCLYCYVNEVFQWLSAIDRPVARRFRKLLSLGRRTEDFREIIISHAEPITADRPEAAEFGVCDVCGEYSDELTRTREGWVCGDCSGE